MSKAKKTARKAGKRAVAELGGRKKVRKAVGKTAAATTKNPRKAGSKLVEKLGGKTKVKRAIKRALAGAAAIAAGLRAKAIRGADA